MKLYSMRFVVPDGFKNDYILVKAKNKKDAKELVLKELAKINEMTIEVYEKPISDAKKIVNREQLRRKK